MKKTLLAFGDSNTWGAKPENDIEAPLERWGDEERWAGVLENALGDSYKVLVDGLCGRTTVWEDPVEEYRKGKDQIIPAMDASAPIEALIISLGSNDLKTRYSASPQDIAAGAGLLVKMASRRVEDFKNGQPKIILICPPPLGAVSKTAYRHMFGGSEEKSKKLREFFAIVAKERGVTFFDAGSVVKPSEIDGLHFDRASHSKLGCAIANVVRELLA
jgi:lysophospholipase L1-like esterase